MHSASQGCENQANNNNIVQSRHAVPADAHAALGQRVGKHQLGGQPGRMNAATRVGQASSASLTGRWCEVQPAQNALPPWPTAKTRSHKHTPRHLQQNGSSSQPACQQMFRLPLSGCTDTSSQLHMQPGALLSLLTHVVQHLLSGRRLLRRHQQQLLCLGVGCGQRDAAVILWGHKPQPLHCLPHACCPRTRPAALIHPPVLQHSRHSTSTKQKLAE